MHQTHTSEIPERKRTFGSAGESVIGMAPGHRTTERVLSYRRLLLSRAKLKATSRTSALLSGFAMVAMVEIQLSDNLTATNCEDMQYPSCNTSLPTCEASIQELRNSCVHYNRLLIAFAVVTTLLIATHMFALLISTCILPNLEAVNSITGSGMDISESPHDKFQFYIEMAWICSTGFGIILFLVEIGLLCWIKFFHTPQSALAATIILIPLVVLFAFFAVEFYRRLVDHKEATATSKVKELDELFSKLEDDNANHSSTTNLPAIVIMDRRHSSASDGSDHAATDGGIVY